MAYVPAAPYNLNYQQNFEVFDEFVYFEYNPADFNGSAPFNIGFLNVPSWLQVIDIYYNTTTSEPRIQFTLRINTNAAYNLNEGDYSAEIRLRFNWNVFGNANATYTGTPLLVTLNVQHTTVLSVTPSPLTFNYQTSGPTPSAQTLSVVSGTIWNVIFSPSWVTLSTTNGNGNGLISVNVNPSGLAVGAYSDIIEIQDSFFTRQVVVTLTVTGPDTDTTFLFLTPQNLQFVSELGVDNTTVKTLSLEASHAWNVVSSQSWLQISSTSGSAGNQSLDVTVDSDELTDLNVSYIATLVFTSQGIQKTVFVELILVELLIDGLTSDTLYFADDNNVLQVTNIFPNNFLLLEGYVSNGSQNTVIKRRAPYQNGLAKQYFGLETNYLLKSKVPTNDLTTRVKNDILPTISNFDAINKNRSTDATTLVESFQNIRFLRGKTPATPNKLCYIPSAITVTRKAVISLSVLATTAPTDIVVTGDYTGTFSSVINNDLYVYNAILNLEPLGLVPGNTINVVFGSLSLDVYIQDDVPETKLLAFENEWLTHEFFECKGFFTEEKTANQTTTTIQDVDVEHTKITEIESGVNYVINTGWIHTRSEIEWLSKVLDSKRVFMYENNEPVEIVLTTKKLEVYKTRENLRSYNLKFKKARV